MSFVVLESVVGLIEPVSFSFFCISGWGIDLDYRDIEWFALETNQDHSVILEIAPKNAFQTLSLSFIDTISSKGFSLTVVDMMVI